MIVRGYDSIGGIWPKIDKRQVHSPKTFFRVVGGLWNARFFSGGLRIVEVRGVVILDRDHRQWPLSGEIELQGGDELSFQSGASASIRFQRGATTLRFSRSAQLRLESVRNGKAIRLNRGLLVGVVSRQPRNAPIRVLTPHAEAQVLGTEFTLFADNQKTRLEVWDGKVHLRRTSDDASTTVSKGQFAVAANGVPLVNRPLSRGVLWEYWLGLNGQTVGDLTADPRSPDQPTGKDYLPAFEAPTNWADHYGARAHAWLRPPATGAYTFWIAADDAAELWLSPDENSENKVRICWTENWTRPREWDKQPEQKSSPIVLKADRLYYIEARHREAGGGDCLAVAWKAPDREREIIPADQLNLPDETQDLARLESGRRKALSPR